MYIKIKDYDSSKHHFLGWMTNRKTNIQSPHFLDGQGNDFSRQCRSHEMPFGDKLKFADDRWGYPINLTVDDVVKIAREHPEIKVRFDIIQGSQEGRSNFFRVDKLVMDVEEIK